MILRDALDIRRGTAQRSKIYKGTYKVWDRNKIVLEGYCKQGVPSEYQQVEYIESTGTQWINTGFPLFNYENHEIIMDFAPTEFFNYNTLFGTGSGPDIIEGWIYVNSALACRYNYVRYSPTDYQTTINTRYLLDLKKEGTTLSEYIDNNLIGTATASTVLFDESLYLLKSGEDYGKHKLYNCKLYSNGTLVRNFIPCYRKSDSVIGLYDLVNNVFYTNAGTGTFNKGADVPNPNYPQEIEVMEGKQVVNVKSQDFEVDLKSKNKFDNITEKKVISTDGIIYNNNSWNLSDYIKVKPNTQFTFSRYDGTNQSLIIAEYTLNQTFIQRNTQGDTIYNIPYTITTSNTTEYIRLNYNSTYGTTKLQLEEGSATDYEPYYNYKLAGIGDYKDNIYTKKGKWYVKSLIGKVVLDGSENWGNGTSSGWYRFYTLIKNSIYISGRQKVLSNYFHFISSGNEVGAGFISSNTLYLYPNQTISTTADFKTWLSTHNTEVYYALATPTEEEITSPTLIQQLNRLYQAM